MDSTLSTDITVNSTVGQDLHNSRLLPWLLADWPR